MKKLLSFLFLSIVIIEVNCQNASVREEYISFPTYPFSEPDPVAKPGQIYPYFRFDGYSTTATGKKIKMVVLENKWIKVWMTPEIGGKVWGALDKKNNRYFIYYNNVVKFRDIAMRGAWTSGGIEFNFGRFGHAPTTATPVDYLIRNNPDGSASCFVGSIDLPSGTEWRVEVRLPGDKAWMEINSYWNNPTNMRTSLYHWQTAAADAGNDLQFYFPGNAYIDHSGNAFSWPLMSNGRDISLYRNNNYNSSHSYHILGEYADWFAGYYHDSDYGFGHLTRYPEKPGKKIWIWDLSRAGAIWKDLLTDTARGNTQYIEMQTGLLFNQEADESTMSPFKHRFFEPGAIENFTEYWFPLSNVKGVSSISKEGILNAVKDVNGYILRFQSLAYINDTLQITDKEGKVLYEFAIKMEPEQVFEKNVGLKTDNAIIKLAGGEMFFNLQENKTGFSDRPLTTLKDFNWGSVYGLYTRGIEKSRQRLYSEAEGFFTKCLELDQSFLPALTSLADIDFRRLKFDDAEKKLLKVISFDTYDPDANFLYGVLLLKKHEYNKASDAFGVTLRTPQYRSISLNQLALIALREKKLAEAREYVSEALLYNGMDKNIYRTAVAVARLMGDHKTCNSLLEHLLSIDPLCHFAYFEKYLTGKGPGSKKEFTSNITGELNFETYIELSLWYYDAGLKDEAFEVMELCPENPLGDLLTAFLASGRGDNVKSDFYYQRALNAGDRLVFPHREEYAEVLKWAGDRNPGWKVKYYSALLYWSRQRPELAKEYFDECGDQPDSYSFYLARGRYRDQTGSDGEADYIKALGYGADSWRPYNILHDYYISKNQYGKALEISQKAIKIFKTYIIRFDHAVSLLYTGKYDECIAILENTEILPHEGAADGRRVWENASLMNALRYYSLKNYRKALLYAKNGYRWPENLGVGKPFKVDERAENYISSLIFKKLGQNKESYDLLIKVANYNEGKPEDGSSLEFLSFLALNNLGRKEEATTYFNRWLDLCKSKRIAEWAELVSEKVTKKSVGQSHAYTVEVKEGKDQPWIPEGTDPYFRIINEIVQSDQTVTDLWIINP